MNKIYLNSKDFNFNEIFYGYESNIYLFDSIHLMKIFKTDNIEVLKNKLTKIELLSEINSNDVLPVDLVYIDDIFKGYTSIFRNNFKPINSLEQKKKIKYYILNEVAKKMSFYHSLGIALGDIHEGNILFNKDTNEVILCDLDNTSISNIGFDILNNFQKDYLKYLKSSLDIDAFTFNLLTVSYIQNVLYSRSFSYLREFGLKGLLNTSENRQIAKQMITFSSEFSGDLFINHVKKRTLF